MNDRHLPNLAAAVALCALLAVEMKVPGATQAAGAGGEMYEGEPANLSVLVSDNTFSFGVNPLDTWVVPQTSVITNNGDIAEEFVARSSPFRSGSDEWSVSSGSNGADSIRAQWSLAGPSGPWTDISNYDSDFVIAAGVAVGDSVTLWFRIQTPTSSASYSEYLSMLTVTARQ